MIRILLAHPSRLVCDSLRTMLEEDEDILVAGSATKAEELHFLLPHGNFILLGTELKDANAFDLLEQIREQQPAPKVLVMGVRERPQTIVRYIEAGAAGYVLQNETAEALIKKLKAAYADKAIVSPKVAAALMERLTQLAKLDMPISYIKSKETRLDELTARENEVIDLIAEGNSNQEIANELVIQCGTVKNHVHNILKKLDVNNRHEAASIFQIHQQSAQAAQMPTAV